jgi:hypothetical protein
MILYLKICIKPANILLLLHHSGPEESTTLTSLTKYLKVGTCVPALELELPHPHAPTYWSSLK